MAAASAYSFPGSLKELVVLCSEFYKENKERIVSEDVRRKRASFCSFVESFHKDCGTLTPIVQMKIETLRNENCIVLMTAHQPNLFAYSGVFRKATLNFVLSKRLEEQLNVPVISFFGIADQDFSDDRWVRSAQVPAVKKRDGVLTLQIKLPEKVMLNKVPKPSRSMIEGWKKSIEEWLDDALRSVTDLYGNHGIPKPDSEEHKLHSNFESLWNLVEDAYERCTSYSDFNGFFMSKVINEVWHYDTLFSRFSECQQIFASDFAFLLSRFADYSKALGDVVIQQVGTQGESGVSSEEPKLAPFWYHCECGSKAKLLLLEQDGILVGNGDCLSCQHSYGLDFGVSYDPNVADIASRISARAVSMALVFFRGLGVSCYVGGIGGATYLTQARYVADQLGVAFPPIVVWRPHDRYSGVGQIEVLSEVERMARSYGGSAYEETLDRLSSKISQIQNRLKELAEGKEKTIKELKHGGNNSKLIGQVRSIADARNELLRSSGFSVLNHDLKILKNVATVRDMSPSVIDYAVNVGLRETSDHWVRFLDENGGLCSDVKFESVLSQTMEFNRSLLTGCSFHVDEL